MRMDEEVLAGKSSAKAKSKASSWWRPTMMAAVATTEGLQEEQLRLASIKKGSTIKSKSRGNNEQRLLVVTCEQSSSNNSSNKSSSIRSGSINSGSTSICNDSSKQQQSYSKIFGQYLPASLNNNLNSSITRPGKDARAGSSSSSSSSGNIKSASSSRLEEASSYNHQIDYEYEKRHQQQVNSNNNILVASQQLWQQSSVVVSALSRLSVRSGKNNNIITSSHDLRKKSSEDYDRDLTSITQTSGQNKKHQEVVLEFRSKKKGFSYMKKNSGKKLVTKLRDLNNNTINFNNNYDNSASFYINGRVDEHKTRLIEEYEGEEEEEEEEEEENLNEDHYVTPEQKSYLSPKGEESGRNMRGQKKSSFVHRDGINRVNQSNKSGFLLATFFTLIICLFSLSSIAKLPVLALQQPAQASPQQLPFVARSQSPVTSVAGANQRALPQPAAGSLVANVNCNKIRGHVSLTPNLQGGTSISAQITSGPPGEIYQWSLHQFPVKPGAAMCSCSSLILGSKLIDMSQLHGNLPSDQEQNVQSSINLFGPDSPVGHSLMLRGLKTGVVACATFLPTSRKSNYRAKFHMPLSGSITIFQTAFGTSFISHLMYSNGTRRHSSHQFDLVRSDDDIITTPLQPVAPSSGGRFTSGGQLAEQQSLNQLEQREHDNELNQCKRLLINGGGGETLLKNSSYQLSVSTENFGMRGRTSMVLPQIPFETFSSIYIVIYSEYNSQEPIACAPLKFVKPKVAAAKFQSVSVQGNVVFSQDSPYDVTVARINLQLPNSDGHSYGIDELPMIIRRKSDTRVCPNIREIIYNPHHIEPSSVPPEGEATSDQYAVGDLSGKYGSLTGKSSEKLQINDYNLPLFGPISIIGRAMTIYSADGVAIACSNVELTTPMTTAFATFDFGIQGQFIFRQPVNDCNGDTYVYIEVSKPVQQQQQQLDPSSHQQHNQQTRSIDHNWHIHVSPVDSGLDHLSTTDCSPAGGHFNPYNTSTSGIYNRDCTPFNVLRCELGDLSAKMFTIDIPPYRVKAGQEPDIGKFFGTDIDLPLCGPVSVVNRSVVVHVQDFGSQRLACSTIIEFKPRT